MIGRTSSSKTVLTTVQLQDLQTDPGLSKNMGHKGDKNYNQKKHTNQ